MVAGTLSVGALQPNPAGDWSAAAGAVFDSGTGTLVFDGFGAQSLASGGSDANHDFTTAPSRAAPR